MSMWDPWKRYEKEQEHKIRDPYYRVEYWREREQWDPFYRYERQRERYFTDPMYRFEKEMDRLSWDPWYRELRRREWKYDEEGNMLRDRVLSDLDRDTKGNVVRGTGTRQCGSKEIPEWLEIAKIKAWADYYSGPSWLGWVKIGLSISMIIGALVWYFFFLP